MPGTALLWLIISLLASVALCGAAETRPARLNPSPQPTGRYWIYFTPDDRPEAEIASVRAAAAYQLSTESLQRRRRFLSGNPPLRACDLPPAPSRQQALERAGCEIVHVARYIHAVSVRATPAALNRALALPFVDRIKPVLAFAVNHEVLEGERLSVGAHGNAPVLFPSAVIPAKAGIQNESYSSGMPGSQNLILDSRFRGNDSPKLWSYSDFLSKGPTNQRALDPSDYGYAWAHTRQVNLQRVHERGYFGEGVILGCQDTGFNNLLHNCFASLRVLAAYDFVNDDPRVGDEGDMGSGSHGSRVLSIMAGRDSARYIGGAPRASFVLTKTENTDSELQIEEDYWIAGLWFNDSAGTRVLSSSLSYTDWYAYEDLDGRTAPITRAADSAAAAGMIIVNSAGNSGREEYPYNKVGAPADGFLVITAGGVISDSSYWTASSQGPTYDGRIKPDVSALGVGVWRIDDGSLTEYEAGNGTSYSCPIIASICALMVEANPDLSAADVQRILHETSSLAGSPDTLRGYGIPDALAAVIRAEQMSIRIEPVLPEGFAFEVYPNPFNGMLRLSLPVGVHPTELALYDGLGRRLRRYEGCPESLRLDDLAAGNYFLRVENPAGVAVQRVVKVK